MIRAIYMDRRGAGVSRTVKTAQECERILRNTNRAARGEIRVVNGAEVIGRRWKLDGKWAWSFDAERFS